VRLGEIQMSDENKVVKLTRVVTEAGDTAPKYPTYEELLLGHLGKVSASTRASQPVTMVITCLTEDGNIQEILCGECVAQVIGLLEITKQNIYLDSMGVLE
jgi:hypothetical protein